MSERITRQQLEERCVNVNRRLQATGRGVQVQGRNGYFGLDEYMRDPDATISLPDSVPGRGYGWMMTRTLTCGTKREVADYLTAMMVGIDLLRSAA